MILTKNICLKNIKIKLNDLDSLISSKTKTDPDGWIIPSTQMIKTNPFLWNGPSKIQFFTDI